MIRVWDPLVRVLHWMLVSAVALAALSVWALFEAHQPAGYVALGAVLLRALWGFVGAGHARFSAFVRGPRETVDYARALVRGREPRYLGHNPLGACMVLALMLCVIGLAVSGWLYTSDAMWGDERVELVHLSLAWVLLGLVCLHVAGVIFTSLRHHENLVRAMFDGSKREH